MTVVSNAVGRIACHCTSGRLGAGSPSGRIRGRGLGVDGRTATLERRDGILNNIRPCSPRNGRAPAPGAVDQDQSRRSVETVEDGPDGQ
jgi:hypothetical protein